MNKMNFKIAIIGNGKLAKSIVLGLLKSGFKPGQIIVIGRETSDLEWFSKKVNISRNMEEIATASHIIIAVTPDGCGDTLVRIRDVNLQRLWGYEIISFTSGLLTEQISNVIPENVLHRTIAATCNTNIAYGHGIICSTRDSSLLVAILGSIVLIWISRAVWTGRGNV
jgi:pyrroline-5-carboxylate reductase